MMQIEISVRHRQVIGDGLVYPTYIFTAPTCTPTIISLETCALNAEFQHFILRLNKTTLLCRYP
jgi:hypothetical protein